MPLHIDPAALAVLEKVNQFLAQRQIEAYLVGGFVRDGLIGRATGDIDIAVNADALALAADMSGEFGGKLVILDQEHKIARIVLDLSPNKWFIDLSSLDGDIEHDLARRDFTLDAMAVRLGSALGNPDSIPIIDPMRGMESLRKGQIKVTGESIFQADPLRLLRAFRLSAELGFIITPNTEDQLRRDSHLISGVSGERIRDELLAIMATDRAGESVSRMDNLGLLTAIIPGLEASRGVEQPKEHYWDVLNHSIKTVSAVEFLLRRNTWQYASAGVRDDVPWSIELARHFDEPVSSGSSRAALIKIAGLLHDIAKPETKIIAGGRVRFFGHTEQGAEAAKKILTGLRFSNKETGLVELMVRQHLRPTQMTHEGLPTRRAIYRYFRDCGISGIDILFLSLADHLAARGPDLDLDNWKWHTRQVNFILTEYLARKEIANPTHLIDGHDLIRLFGMQPGPLIGSVLEAVKEAQAAGELKSREEALSYVKNRVL